MYPILITLAVVGLYCFVVVKLLRKKHPVITVLLLLPVIPGGPCMAWSIYMVFFTVSEMMVSKAPIAVGPAPTLILLPKRFDHDHMELQVCIQAPEVLGTTYQQAHTYGDEQLKKLFQARARTTKGEFHTLDGTGGLIAADGYWFCRTEPKLNTYRDSTYDAIEVSAVSEFSIPRMKIVSRNWK